MYINRAIRDSRSQAEIARLFFLQLPPPFSSILGDYYRYRPGLCSIQPNHYGDAQIPASSGTCHRDQRQGENDIVTLALLVIPRREFGRMSAAQPFRAKTGKAELGKSPSTKEQIKLNRPERPSSRNSSRSL
jgi:hypothetical protein